MFIKPHSYSDDYSNRSFPLSKKCRYLSNHLPLILGYSTTLASSGNSFSVFHSALTSLYTSHSSRHWGNSIEQCTAKSLPCGCHSGGERNNTANKGILTAVDLAVRNARRKKLILIWQRPCPLRQRPCLFWSTSGCSRPLDSKI